MAFFKIYLLNTAQFYKYFICEVVTNDLKYHVRERTLGIDKIGKQKPLSLLYHPEINIYTCA